MPADVPMASNQMGIPPLGVSPSTSPGKNLRTIVPACGGCPLRTKRHPWAAAVATRIQLREQGRDCLKCLSSSLGDPCAIGVHLKVIVDLLDTVATAFRQYAGAANARTSRSARTTRERPPGRDPYAARARVEFRELPSGLVASPAAANAATAVAIAHAPHPARHFCDRRGSRCSLPDHAAIRCSGPRALSADQADAQSDNDRKRHCSHLRLPPLKPRRSCRVKAATVSIADT